MTRTATKGERNRTTTTKQNTSNSSYKFFPWALTRLLFLTNALFKVDAYFFKVVYRFFLCSGMKIEFLL